MKKTTKPLIIFIAAVMVMVPFSAAVMAQDEIDRNEPSAEAMVADLLLIRPLGFLGLALGAVLNLIALPFSPTKENREEVQRKLVEEPYKFTFNRRVGDF